MPPGSRQGNAPIHIILVEDSPSDAALELDTLTRSGLPHTARRVESEQQLRAALSSQQPDIILSDFSLPQFDGLSALKVARELAPQIPFIFVSGRMGEERAIDALRSGAVDYVLKSNLRRLPPAVRRAVDEAAIRQRHERRIARLDRVLRMLSGVSGAAVRIRDRTELLRESCRLAVSIGGYAAVVAMLKVGGNPIVQPLAWGGADDAAAQALRDICAAAAARPDSLIGRALQSGKAAVCNDTGENGAEAHASASFNEPMAQAGLLSAVALPILVDGTALGALLLAGRDPGTVGDEELRLLSEVAGNLSFALQYLHKDTTVRFLSHFDPQTGLAKRALLRDRLAKLMLECATRRSRYAVAILDIERLGLINDSFGRRTGDLLLQHVSARLKRHWPQTDKLAHFGGGTFGLMWEPLASVSANELLSESQAHVAAVFGEPFTIEQRDIPVAVRCGVALYPQDGDDAETLIQHAEAALLHARTSADRQLLYSAERHSHRIGGLALEHKLRLALERREFELHYQAKVNVITRRIEGVEALIRWRDPAGGLVAPAAFLPAVESAGLGAAVGTWVIEQAAHDCHQWLRAGLPPVRVAVNLSSAQLQQPDFAARFQAAVQPWASSVWGLDIEVTEGALQEERTEEVQQLNLLRRGGVRIAVDDFGTGYSSLRRLSALPIDTLKIDGSFISQVPADVAGKAVVKTIIALARAFNMTTVAEGVERQEQLDFLWQVGCDQSQGYLHSKPVTCDEFARLLEHGNGNLVLPARSLEAAEDPDTEQVE